MTGDGAPEVKIIDRQSPDFILSVVIRVVNDGRDLEAKFEITHDPTRLLAGVAVASAVLRRIAEDTISMQDKKSAS